MIHINLLPVRQLRKRLQVRNEVAIYVASLLVLLVAISLVTLNKVSRISDLQGENKVLSDKKKSYQPILNEIDKLKKDKQVQETKLDVIKKLKTGSHITVRVMNDMADLIPPGRLWLNTFKQAGDRLTIAGIALDNATIAQFMDSIAESDLFSGSELAKSSQTVVAGAKLKSFSLSIGISDPENAETAKGKK